VANAADHNVMLTKLTSKIIQPKAAILLAIFAFCGFANAQQFLWRY